MTRLLITGSRYATAFHRPAISKALQDAWLQLNDWCPGEKVVLVQGGARGVDIIARDIWTGLGLQSEQHDADWYPNGRGSALDRGAGHKRNAKMVQLGADLCVGFPIAGEPNKGTRGCMELAAKAGIGVIEVELRKVN